MSKYRKLPVIIDAWLWDGEQDTLVAMIFLGLRASRGHFGEADELTLHTLEGRMNASLGDYIIMGVKGEFYPCKPDIFAMTYEAVRHPND